MPRPSCGRPWGLTPPARATRIGLGGFDRHRAPGSLRDLSPLG
jgi:hypothetical protein